MMDRQQVIDAIRLNNPSADKAFLEGFEIEALGSYLSRLTRINGHRGPASRWVRQGDTPAIVTRSAYRKSA